MKNRVVITGMGIYSCLGKNLEEVRQSLYAGKSGIGIDAQRIAYGYRSPLTGIVERPQLKGLLDRRSRICLAEEGEYAYMATVEALNNAYENDVKYTRPPRLGREMTIISSSLTRFMKCMYPLCFDTSLLRSIRYPLYSWS